VPDAGVYPELIPDTLHASCLYKTGPSDLALKIMEALTAGGWPTMPPDWRKAFRPFDAISACKVIDERLENLADARSGAA